MSKLNEFLADRLNDYHHAWEVKDLLPSHDAEVAAKARKEAMDVACCVQCPRCDLEDALFEHEGEWWHEQCDDDALPTTICEASDIRAEFARRWPEEFGPEQPEQPE